MLPTITQYRPGIYAEIARRTAERKEREERNRLRADAIATGVLCAVVLGYFAWAAWFALACLTFHP
jgi:hypothetical protein